MNWNQLLTRIIERVEPYAPWGTIRAVLVAALIVAPICVAEGVWHGLGQAKVAITGTWEAWWNA